MTMQTLQLNLGLVAPGQYAPGWYWDANTGQFVYFDGPTQRFYVLQGGMFVPLAQNWNPAPKQVTLAPGNQLKVEVTFNYIGPAVTGVTAHYSINKNQLIGSEAMSKDQTFNIPANLTATPIVVTNSWTFTIPVDVETNWTDIYVRIWGPLTSPNIGGTASAGGYEYGYSNALIIIAQVPTITGFAIKDFTKV